MNENPGETPNPLNPNPATNPSMDIEANAGPANSEAEMSSLDANPSEMIQPATGTRPQIRPIQPVGGMRATARPMRAAAGIESQTEPEQPMTESENLSNMIDSLDPTNRPMEQSIQIEKPKKKKTGLIVCIVILVLALIGGGVAAALVLMNQKKTDPVAEAVSKIMRGGGAENIAVSGTIGFEMKDKSSPISGLEIDLDSKVVASSMINSSQAKVTVTLKNGGEYSVSFDEVYAANGDLYFKIQGINEALEESRILQDGAGTTGTLEENNCVTDESGKTNCTSETVEVVSCEGEADCVAPEAGLVAPSGLETGYLSQLLGVVGTVDGEWLRVSTDELNLVSGDALPDSRVSCMADMMTSIKSSSNVVAEAYNKSPFVTSTSENIPIASRQNPVYEVHINSDNFANFIGSIQNSSLATNLYSCLGWHGNVQPNTDNIATLIDSLPKMYVEIDENYNFTRLYLENELMQERQNFSTTIDVNEVDCEPCLEDEECYCQESEEMSDDVETELVPVAMMTIDLAFSYPSNVSVPEPLEYKNFSEVIQEIMTGLFVLPGAEIDENSAVAN